MIERQINDRKVVDSWLVSEVAMRRQKKLFGFTLYFRLRSSSLLIAAQPSEKHANKTQKRVLCVFVVNRHRMPGSNTRRNEPSQRSANIRVKISRWSVGLRSVVVDPERFKRLEGPWAHLQRGMVQT